MTTEMCWWCMPPAGCTNPTLETRHLWSWRACLLRLGLGEVGQQGRRISWKLACGNVRRATHYPSPCRTEQSFQKLEIIHAQIMWLTSIRALGVHCYPKRVWMMNKQKSCCVGLASHCFTCIDHYPGSCSCTYQTFILSNLINQKNRTIILVWTSMISQRCYIFGPVCCILNVHVKSSQPCLIGNRISRRSIQSHFSLFSIIFYPLKSKFV